MSKTHDEITEWLKNHKTIKEDIGMFISMGWPGLRGGAKPSQARQRHPLIQANISV